MTRRWDGPFGAVMPFEAPSWFTALPRMTARIGRPAVCASRRRWSTTTAAPSDQAVPSAAAANGLHRPSGASARWRENSTYSDGVAITVAPPASAIVHSPRRSAFAARWIATSDDEQAVSTVTAGPSRPRWYATRPDAMLGALPGPT
jgi:hypothetical protein